MSINVVQAAILGNANDVIYQALLEEDWISESRRIALCAKLRRRLTLSQTGEGTPRNTPLEINVEEQQADLDIERNAE